jgi:4-amino-4-deoxy-L-arabinose transferase-like glycosyltransferase
METNAICAAVAAERSRAWLFPWPGGSLGWLLAGSGLLLVLWSFAVPVFEAPDEPAHWQYARYVHEQKRLPFYEARFVEANQPPLYYLLIAPFTAPSALPSSAARLDAAGRVIPDFPPSFYVQRKGDVTRYWPIRISRLATCLLSVLTVYFAYLSGVEATGHRSTGLLAGGLTAFLPQFTFRGMNISNDALVATTSAATVYLIVKLIKRGFTPTLGLITAAALALAFLSKINAMLLPVPFALAVLSEKGPWPQRLSRLWPVGIATAVVAPWLLRNIALYGDPLAGKAMWTAVPDLIVPKSITSPYFRIEFPSWLGRSFVGTFGWMNVPMPGWLYLFFAALGLLGIAGFIWRLVRRPVDRRLAGILCSIPLLALVLVVQLNLMQSQPQGRYLFPALTAIALLIALGLEALPRWSERSTIATVICLGLVNVGVLGGTIVPAYGHVPGDHEARVEAVLPPTRRDLSLRYLFKYYKFRFSRPPTDMRMTAGPLLPGTRFAQSVVAQKGNLTRIEVEFATYAVRMVGFLTVRLRRGLDDPQDLAVQTIPLQRLEDDAFVGLQFPAIPDSNGKTYYIVFETRDRSQPITVWLRDGNEHPDERFFVNGQARPQTTYFRTFYVAGTP